MAHLVGVAGALTGGAWRSRHPSRRYPLLVVHDVLPSPVSARADYVLPAATWAEKEGTFVNHAGLAQGIRKAAHAPGESRSEGQVSADLMGRRGLLHAGPVRAELAAAVPALAGLMENLPALGTRLELAVVG